MAVRAYLKANPELADEVEMQIREKLYESSEDFTISDDEAVAELE